MRLFRARCPSCSAALSLSVIAKRFSCPECGARLRSNINFVLLLMGLLSGLIGPTLTMMLAPPARCGNLLCQAVLYGVLCALMVMGGLWAFMTLNEAPEETTSRERDP